DDHSSGIDDQYDALFRQHLKNVYRLLDKEPPLSLERPICKTCSKPIYSAPNQFLEVRVDGQHSNYFEWLGAGHYHVVNPRGTMAASTRGPIKDLYFGFNDREFLLRIDCYRRAHQVLGRFSAIHVLFDGEREVVLDITSCGTGAPRVCVRRTDGPAEPVADARIACDIIFELAVPFSVLGLGAGREVQFVVEFEEPGGLGARYPRESSIAFRVPTADFEARMWTA
ncbi:MAG: alpha-amylase/alpha-mannosidase, partial [Candidatus Hydrogenedentes bacterium]|nr:alpha-amylase/alpha-mannosidase [Candidatus Hydrogenedentota bacterium]